ncbi:bola-like protein [Rhizoctonia solani]|nr:bola-like protein [Rhizoctonia solani]
MLASRRLLQAAMSSPSTTNGPVYQAISEKLAKLLNPTSLEITNDSWQHRHHTAMRESGGGNGETHFTVRVISDSFIGKTTMQRHRMIYGALSEELAQGVHALSLQTKTPDEANKPSAQN